MSFEIERRGERVAGRAAGIDRRHLARLVRGAVEADYEIDLHGLTAEEARAAVRGAVRDVRASGGRCLLVVHGRGRHSDTGPVLKDALVDWLTAAPVSGAVMAFASAQPEDGGTGATYVLLRRGVRGPHSG